MERNMRRINCDDMEGSTSGLQHFSDTGTSASESDCDDQGNHDSSDCDSSGESDSSIDIRPRRLKTTLIESESDSESDWDIIPSKRSRLPELAGESSSSESDGQSDKCPICLAKFKGQEIGLPNTCEHSFCFECILEWSKNVTTCPIDRQQFQKILVKKHLGGCVVRETAAQTTQTEELGVEVLDPTFCEVCGASDREDRMLLCDGCDLGYHLECLTPPLERVPPGNWLCPDCGPEDIQDVTIYVDELDVLYHDAMEIGPPANSRRLPRSNIVPRTRQSDRIRARIISNRQNNRISTSVGNDNIQVTVNQLVQPSTSRHPPCTTATRKRRQKRRKTRKAKPRIKITYEPSTGKKVVIEANSYRKSSKRKRKSRTARRRAAKVAVQNLTAKRRLAQHFGICAPTKPGQILPDMRVTVPETTGINSLRGQAGIPSLDLLGHREEFDYFSGSDENDEGDGGASTAGTFLVRRRPNMNDAAIFRRSAARKLHLLPSAIQTSNGVDILGSIMDSQEKIHSRNAVLSLNKDGSLIVDNNRNTSGQLNRNRVNINDSRHFRIRNVPGYSTNDNPANIANVNSPQECRGNSSTTSSPSGSATISNNSVSTSTLTQHGTGSSSLGGMSSSNDGLGGINSVKNLYSDIGAVSTSKVQAENSKNKDTDESTVKLRQDKPENFTEDTTTNNTHPQDEDVSSTTNVLLHDRGDEADRSIENTDDEECPNFSIYSKDTINLVANRSLGQDEVGSSLDVGKTSDTNVKENQDVIDDDVPPPPTTDGEDEDDEDQAPAQKDVDIERSDELDVELNADVEEINDDCTDKPPSSIIKLQSKFDSLYSDSDEEANKVDRKSFGIGDIRDITEDISDEERSYTPCLDERGPAREGIEGLDTEAISDDEKDFDESHEHKTVSDAGDALEINAKESELDFSKPEDFEEGEIVDKLKKAGEAMKALQKDKQDDGDIVNKAKEAIKKKDTEYNAPVEKDSSTSFKRISKNLNRNYRDKDRSRSHSKERNKENERDKKRERKKEKRKELERYNVRNVVSEKPRKSTKDKFGRDARKRSTSRSSRSHSPPCRSVSRGRRSASRDRRKRRGRSRNRSSSRSRSRSRKRSISRKRRSISRSKRRRSVDEKKRKKRSPSRQRSRSKHRDWEREREPQNRKRWTPSLSRSRSPERQPSPSWTPPRMHENKVKPHNLTVILTNDANKSKKKDKRKGEKKKKDSAIDKSKKRKRDKTPLPSKEVFASGDNILVSVSFNKETEELSKKNSKQRVADVEITTKRTRKDKDKKGRERTKTRTPPPPVSVTKPKKKKIQQDLSGVKPVAIIDLDRSPFKELTPSPKDVIVLSDSDHSPEKVVPDSSQQSADYSLGPKTPPEPQVKFSLAPKAPQIRQISNPLHDPDEENEETEIDPQDELEQRLNDALHKGPNTPSEPPNSPPSSPDAYDPFDPTKSRSPTPENEDNPETQIVDDSHSDVEEEREIIPLSKTPEVPVGKSHTPPLADIQPADSQTNVQVGGISPEDPEKSSQQCSGATQGNSPIFSSKAKTTTTGAVASTPTASITTTPRVNMFNSTILTPICNTAQPPPRITNPPSLKPSPTKASVKMLPKRTPNISAGGSAKSKPAPKSNNSNNKNRSTDSNDSNMDLDSPYSPGPSDFEDLFEPPSDHKNKSKQAVPSVQQPPLSSKSSNKNQSTFDILFGSPGNGNANKSNKGSGSKKKEQNSKVKQVGLKFDEDSLKILDDLPNSAVEMQVKDKYLKKLNRQERVVEEVKLVLKPHYNKKHINKDEYKDILRRAVPKICHNKAGEINPKKIQNLIEAYVKKVRHTKKVSSSSSVSVQK